MFWIISHASKYFTFSTIYVFFAHFESKYREETCVVRWDKFLSQKNSWAHFRESHEWIARTCSSVPIRIIVYHWEVGTRERSAIKTNKRQKTDRLQLTTKKTRGCHTRYGTVSWCTTTHGKLKYVLRHNHDLSMLDVNVIMVVSLSKSNKKNSAGMKQNQDMRKYWCVWKYSVVTRCLSSANHFTIFPCIFLQVNHCMLTVCVWANQWEVNHWKICHCNCDNATEVCPCTQTTSPTLPQRTYELVDCNVFISRPILVRWVVSANHITEEKRFPSVSVSKQRALDNQKWGFGNRRRMNIIWVFAK